MVNIDTVYQKVLALANKEQRGYITPQEFNLYADHAQKEIFEQYFYDISQWDRQPGNSHEASDVLTMLDRKLSVLEHWAHLPNTNLANNLGDINLDQFPRLYRLVEVKVNYGDGSGYHVAEEVSTKQLTDYQNIALVKPSIKRPVYAHFFERASGDERIRIHPAPPVIKEKPLTSYIFLPKKPEWSYVILGDKALYNANTSVNFQLHQSEEIELIYKILKLAGINLNKAEVVQVAQTLDTQNVQQEKA